MWAVIHCVMVLMAYGKGDETCGSEDMNLIQTKRKVVPPQSSIWKSSLLQMFSGKSQSKISTDFDETSRFLKFLI